MATDRYSDDHKIVVGGGGGTLTVDANLIVDADLTVNGDINLSGGGVISSDGGIISFPDDVNFSGPVSITTPSGDIDFSSSSLEVRRSVPMTLLEWLDSNGYSSTPLFQAAINIADTTSDSFSFDTPGLVFQLDGDSITIPIHELLKKGGNIKLYITCEFVDATNFTSIPMSFTYKKILKAGSSTSPYENGTSTPALQATSFLNNTRKEIIVTGNIDFDSTQDLFYLTLLRGDTSYLGSPPGYLVVYSIDISTTASIYDILGLE
jgi:hypothetical protein